MGSARYKSVSGRISVTVCTQFSAPHLDSNQGGFVLTKLWSLINENNQRIISKISP